MRLIYVYVLLSCVIGGLAGLDTASADPRSKLRNFEFEHVAGQAIVKPVDGMLAASLEDRFASLGVRVKSKFRSSGAYVLDFANIIQSKKDFQAALIDLASDPGIEYIEANTIMRMDELPNDPKFGELYGLQNNGQNGGTAGADIKAVTAWDTSKGSRDVVVAIIDTGVNYLHPDIAPNYWNNPGETGLDANGNDKSSNGIDDDGNGYIDDWRGWDFVNNDNDPMDDNSSYHGTHCAGTIGGHGNDGVGIVGVNWNVSMVGAKFLSASGSGTLEAAVQAIEYTTKLGVTMTSNSWGGGGYSDTMAAAITEAQTKGILFVAAAGNSASNNDISAHYPSSYAHDNVISVAATDKNDRMADFSCYGATSVDLAAPGVDIVSASSGDTFQTLSGTSMATPHVAGAAALVKAAMPNLTAEKIKMRLMFGADLIPATQGKTLSGGRLNVANAVEIDSIAPAPVVLVEATAASRSSVSLKWEASGDDASDGVASAYEVRYAAQPIVSVSDWNSATKARVVQSRDAESNQWAGAIEGLPLNFQGYASVRAYDNVGNISALSDDIAIAVTPVRVLMTNRADSMEGVVGEGTWNVEAVAGANGTAFSDSPGNRAADNANASLYLPAVNVPAGAVLALAISAKTDLERGYDFGYVEVLPAGATSWTRVAQFTGTRDWFTEEIDLTTAINGATQFQIRFRIETDSSITYDGWYIDDVSLIANQQ